MELAFIVYLISILENVKGFFIGVAVVSAVVAFFIFWMRAMAEEFPKWIGVTALIICTISSSITAILPTEKQAYTIAAAYAGQKIAENEKVQEIGGKIVVLLNQKLDNAIKEEKK